MNTVAILVGNATYDYEETHDLPPAKHNVQKLKEIFSQADFKKVIDLVDVNQDDISKSFGDLNKELEESPDVFVFYYAGHGELDDDLKLKLKTKREHGFIEFGTLKRLIDSNQSDKNIVILDCCFSGAASYEELGDRYTILYSSSQFETTYFNDGDDYSIFTRELIDILTTGILGKKKFLSISDIHEELEPKLKDYKDRISYNFVANGTVLNHSFLPNKKEEEKFDAQNNLWTQIKDKFEDDIIGLQELLRHKADQYDKNKVIIDAIFPSISKHFSNVLEYANDPNLLAENLVKLYHAVVATIGYISLADNKLTDPANEEAKVAYQIHPSDFNEINIEKLKQWTRYIHERIRPEKRNPFLASLDIESILNQYEIIEEAQDELGTLTKEVLKLMRLTCDINNYYVVSTQDILLFNLSFPGRKSPQVLEENLYWELSLLFEKGEVIDRIHLREEIQNNSVFLVKKVVTDLGTRWEALSLWPFVICNQQSLQVSSPIVRNDSVESTRDGSKKDASLRFLIGRDLNQEELVYKYQYVKQIDFSKSAERRNFHIVMNLRDKNDLYKRSIKETFKEFEIAISGE